MTRDQVIDYLVAKLGQRTDLETSGAIISELDLAQSVRLEQEAGITPWFLETQITSQVTIANQHTIALPTGFLREDDEKFLQLLDASTGEYSELKKESLSILESKYPGTSTTDSDAPLNYARYGVLIHIYPLSTQAFALKTRYYAADVLPSTLAGSGTNLWMTYAPDLLIAEAGLFLTRDTQDDGNTKIFAALKAAALLRLQRNATAREEQGRMRQMGED